ncbi:MAG: iron-containing alcohol dehydrogenase [Prevotellaceae bacterium]|jgi:3-deoxy-alpha-D-manno-octulosonate 8-oxidase|nr:iron-containing alcohol dehydrogenase [Prevotellaceae bacterium]
MVPHVIYGRGSFDDLGEIIALKRQAGAPFIFLVDDVFAERTSLVGRIPLAERDKIIFINTTDEPKTKQVDALRDQLQEEFGTVSGIVGIGGGSIMDLTKAVGLMMTHEGSSAQYQGWDLLKRPGVYRVGIPTLSGTGAEVSRTAVLTGPERKLGLNSDYTTFDQVLLDPSLTKDAPKNQRFFTGMDCYIHCIESLNGTYLNAFSKSYGEKSQELCEEVFLYKNEWDDESDEALMMASWHGGMSIAYSQVGIAHAVSYGMAFVLGIHHGVGNSIVFNHLEEYYPEGVRKFHDMVSKWGIDLPRNVCTACTDTQFETMIKVSLGMTPLWENALGKNWPQVMTAAKLRNLYERM